MTVTLLYSLGVSSPLPSSSSFRRICSIRALRSSGDNPLWVVWGWAGNTEPERERECVCKCVREHTICGLQLAQEFPSHSCAPPSKTHKMDPETDKWTRRHTESQPASQTHTQYPEKALLHAPIFYGVLWGVDGNVCIFAVRGTWAAGLGVAPPSVRVSCRIHPRRKQVGMAIRAIPRAMPPPPPPPPPAAMDTH